MSETTKIAATMAVLELLRQEEEAYLYMTAIPRMQEKETPWAMSGRQSQMQFRQAMQLKGFHRK